MTESEFMEELTRIHTCAKLLGMEKWYERQGAWIYHRKQLVRHSDVSRQGPMRHYTIESLDKWLTEMIDDMKRLQS